MFDHRNFATQGLFPGRVTHRSIANLGHFEIEVIIEPIRPVGGGGGYHRPPAPVSFKSNKYKVNIRVTRKGKTWTYEKIVGSAIATVLARFLKKTIEEPTVSVINTSIVKEDVQDIKVTANVISRKCDNSN